jgi:hypothetical protein
MTTTSCRMPVMLLGEIVSLEQVEGIAEKLKYYLRAVLGGMGRR